ncbi:MAG TPA: serine--tRNA ligase [Verrucomicrobiae bacterium]|jgi:seryl-tRNA synthetase|nr:serine--tRNA ligase [Verrucomicrobiae bacterium]
MLDIQFIRDNPEVVAEKSRQKGYDVDIAQLLGFDDERRQLLQQVEDLRRQRNDLSGQTKGQKPSDEQLAQGRELKDKLTKLEHQLASIEQEFNTLLKTVPNMPLDDVPVGTSEAQNMVSKTVGEPPKFDFEPKNHAQIAEAKGWLDKERAAKVTGSRFAYLKGDLVQLQFAIIQFVMSKLTDQAFLDEVIKANNLQVSNKPFLLVLPPLMLRTEVYDAMDRLEPRDDRYKIEAEDLWLQGSAEHVLGSMHADEILAEDELPLRYLGYATSFRREAGTYGKDMEGMFRMHQFDKLEMESLTDADHGLQEHLLLVAIQEKLMQLLGIPYQVLTKCTADIGKPNARGIDIEAWLPGQGTYRETHTADYMTDYQARRLQTRVRRFIPATETDGTKPELAIQAGSKVQLVHTNDATALALSRTPIAIIENFQTKEGNVKVPQVLQPFMGGRTEI